MALDEDEFAYPEVAFGIEFYGKVQVVFDFRCIRSEELTDWDHPSEVEEMGGKVALWPEA